MLGPRRSALAGGAPPAHALPSPPGPSDYPPGCRNRRVEIQDVLPRNAIPGVDEPSSGTNYFGDDDEVIAVDGDPPRAYPVRILSYHEIVNDVLGATPPGIGRPPGATGGDRRPIAVTWCPICASAAVYDRTVDGRVLTFGTSGKLADDALVMCDRETGSEWEQPLGTAIAGPLEGRELAVLPAAVLSWDRFRSAHPDGVVSRPVHGGPDDPRGRSPREAYAWPRTTGTTPRPRSACGRCAATGRPVVGPRRRRREDDGAGRRPRRRGRRLPGPAGPRRGRGGDRLGGGLDLVVTTGGDADGEGIHALGNPGSEFGIRDGRLRADAAARDPATGRGDDGRALARVPARRLYAFAWQDDHGPDSFHGLC